MSLRSLLTVFIAILFIAAAKNVLAQNGEGSYGYEKGENTSGEVRVSNANARSFKFKIGIGSRNPACVGEFSNRADWISTNVAEYRFRVVVVHVDRGERIRIISARRATPAEREKYESGAE